MAKLFFSLFFIVQYIVCGQAVGPIQATYWGTQSDSGGCQVPTASYTIKNALALGQATALGNLIWRQGLCGQVLAVDCGNGPVEAVVVSTCNLGSTSCGVDLIQKTWNLATKNATPGIANCNVVLSATNPIAGSAPLCYHRPNSDIGNAYYVILGVLNTSGKITSSASISNIQGSRGNDGWFIFNSNGLPLFTNTAIVSFNYEDGTSTSFQIGNCANGGQTQIFA